MFIHLDYKHSFQPTVEFATGSDGCDQITVTCAAGTLQVFKDFNKLDDILSASLSECWGDSIARFGCKSF